MTLRDSYHRLTRPATASQGSTAAGARVVRHSYVTGVTRRVTVPEVAGGTGHAVAANDGKCKVRRYVPPDVMAEIESAMTSEKATGASNAAA